jgi:hypothetical protein
VAAHPVRITVEDDLRRSRLTVFFRYLLAIPHYVWLVLWSLAVSFVVFINWIATLSAGKAPPGLHRFLGAYVRYVTHVLAYLSLAANPYPGFTGAPGYPIDVEIDGPEPQRRLVTGFRFFLAIPALILAVVFAGMTGSTGGEYGGGTDTSAGWTLGASGGVLLSVAFLAWFAALVTGRMPQGFRDLQAYGIRYVAQTLAYTLVLTDRYPDADPDEQPGAAGPEHPVRVTVNDDLRRSRLTVFFRLFLAIPHIVWLLLWSIAAFVVVVLTWFSALVVGYPPAAFHRFLSSYVRYSTHVGAYLFLTANPFPGFTGTPGTYPIDLELPGPERQRRLVTGFRLFLALPAFLVSNALGVLGFVTAFLAWFYALARGRMPESFRDAQAYVLRYSAQVEAYAFLVTDRYPYSGPVLGSAEAAPEEEPPPLSEPDAAPAPA